MGILLVAAFLFLLAIAFAVWRGRQQIPAKGPFPYEQVKPLTEAEQRLYWRLVEALPECVVLPQVTFSRFMKPATGGKAPLRIYRDLQDRIAQKTIDFLVCLEDFTVVAAIELDDDAPRFEYDRRRDELLHTAGIAVLRLPARDMPSAARLRELFTAESKPRTAKVAPAS